MVLPREALTAFTWGIERETHRIRGDGSPSREKHPASLPQPSFTMDFAESMLELVTRPRPSIVEVLGELDALTRTASRNIGSDLLWPFSMPPALPPEGEIRLAHPGTGEAGRSAERYRNGLALRYGVARQMICGVHVNVSLDPALLAYLAAFAPLSGEEEKERSIRDAYYLRLVRNLVDELDALVFFFGASPLQDETAATLTAPAISIRNSPLGYARGEYRPFFDLDSIAAHAAGIRRGLKTESATFRRLGLERDGKTIQLNGKVFQKEKEFYAPIRFRSIPFPGETSLTALERRGVEYLELRFFDVDPFSPSGVSPDALRLLQLLLLDGLSRVSAPRSTSEWKERLENADEAALGDPFALTADDRLAKAASTRLDVLQPFAEELDGTVGEREYGRVLASYRSRVADPRNATSAKLYSEYKASGTTWTAFGSRIAERNAQGGLDGNA